MRIGQGAIALDLGICKDQEPERSYRMVSVLCVASPNVATLRKGIGERSDMGRIFAKEGAAVEDGI